MLLCITNFDQIGLIWCKESASVTGELSPPCGWAPRPTACWDALAKLEGSWICWGAPGLGNWLLVLWAHLQEQPCSHTKESDSWMALPSLSFPFCVCFWSMPPSPIREGIGPNLSEKDAVASKFWQSVSTQERQLNVSVTLPRMFHTPCFSEFHRKELSDYPAWGVLTPFPMIHDSTRLYLAGTFWSLPKPFISYHTVLSPW